jgi:hypothetical protein
VPNSNQTQIDRLAAFYMDNPDRPLRRRDIGCLIGHGSVTQRNADLRKRGFVIVSSRQKVRGRVVTFFTYISVEKRKRAA